jgi:hypothetical protein
MMKTWLSQITVAKHFWAFAESVARRVFSAPQRSIYHGRGLKYGLVNIFS